MLDLDNDKHLHHAQEIQTLFLPQTESSRAFRLHDTYSREKLLDIIHDSCLLVRAILA